MQSLSLLIFDLDGTLVDAMDQHAEAFSRVLYEEYGISRALSRQEYLRTAGQPLDEQFNHVIGLKKGTEIACVAELLDRFWLLIDESKPVLFPDVREAIEQLAKIGYVQVVTSGCAPFIVESKLKKTGISQFFKLRLGTDKNISNMVKGDGHFKIIRQELNLTLERFRAISAIIGDAVHDINLGKQAGIIAIGRATANNKDLLKQASPDYIVDDLRELAALLIKHTLSLQSTFLPISSLRSATDDIDDKEMDL